MDDVPVCLSIHKFKDIWAMYQPGFSTDPLYTHTCIYMHTYIYNSIYIMYIDINIDLWSFFLRELAHVIVGAGKSKIMG